MNRKRIIGLIAGAVLTLGLVTGPPPESPRLDNFVDAVTEASEDVALAGVATVKAGPRTP